MDGQKGRAVAYLVSDDEKKDDSFSD